MDKPKLSHRNRLRIACGWLIPLAVGWTWDQLWHHHHQIIAGILLFSTSLFGDVITVWAAEPGIEAIDG